MALALLRVPYAALLGTLFFPLYFLPVIGTFVIAALCILAALSQGWVMTLVVAVFMVHLHSRCLNKHKEKHSMANVFETARAKHDYNKFVKGLESLAGLVEAISGPGPFTIFVPTDAAFDRLTGDKQANLFADPEKLAKVLNVIDKVLVPPFTML